MWHHPRTTSGQLPRRRNTIRPTGTCPHTRGRTDDSGTSMTVTAAPQHLFCVVLGGGVAQGTQALAGLGDGAERWRGSIFEGAWGWRRTGRTQPPRVLGIGLPTRRGHGRR